MKGKPPQDCWPTGDSLGAEKLPKVVAKMREIGEYIVSNAPSTRPKESRPNSALHSSEEAAAGAQPPSGFVQDRFAISFFLDPSPTDEAYSFIRDANFSLVLGANYPSNQSEADSMLKMCIKYDLKCITNLKGWAKAPWFAGGNRSQGEWEFQRALPPASSNHWGYVSAGPSAFLPSKVVASRDGAHFSDRVPAVSR